MSFVDGITAIGLDDDLLPLRSKIVGENGYNQIIKPAKGYEVVHYATVSYSTGLYQGGHIQQKNKTTSDFVTLLLKALSEASMKRNIRLQRNHWFWDHGYGAPDGVINRLSNKRGCTLTGTSKRSLSFPFTFGK